MFSQVTVPPISIVTVFGMKQPSDVSSQPGVYDPGALVTVVAAKAFGAIATIDAIAKSTTRELSVITFM